jgi:hypothetical protein
MTIENKELDEIFMKAKRAKQEQEQVQLILQKFDEGHSPSDADCLKIGKHHSEHPEDYGRLRSFILAHSVQVLQYVSPAPKFNMGMS